uniref:Uncharacterized protein n=1 Tax=Oryza punctata TaxID=4537 RepID=A0A0E0LZL8_ORYPU
MREPKSPTSLRGEVRASHLLLDVPVVVELDYGISLIARKFFVFLVAVERSYEALQLEEEHARSLLTFFLEESGKTYLQAEKKHASPLLSCAEKHPNHLLSCGELFPLVAPVEEELSDEACFQAEKKRANPLLSCVKLLPLVAPMEEHIDEEHLQEEKHSGHLLSCEELFPLVAPTEEEDIDDESL